ncbi:MAG: MBL fold metallo-hydrolase [Dehalococcoidales bacterium]|nr:MBL fold metallo-hydrolase [Dehalococcoidales bacterium]
MKKMPDFIPKAYIKWVLLLLAAVAMLLWLFAVTAPDDNLHVSFLDVGQGDAILIQKGDQQVLIDGGPSPQKIGLELGEKMPFWDRTIEMVVLTHPSADHVTGLVEVLNRYNVEQVLYPDLAYVSGIYDEWLRLVRQKGDKYSFVRAGQQIDLGGGVLLEVLNPPRPLLVGTESDIDNNGIVLRLSMGEISFLLTADTMWEAELELVHSRAKLNSTILKVGHHGSTTSTTPQFLVVVNPSIAVISVGSDNEYGHPADGVIKRLEETIGVGNIYCTIDDGTIEFITDGERMWLKKEK